jgi:hypothetical protein
MSPGRRPAWGWARASAAAIATAAVVTAAGTAATPSAATENGDQLLARATSAPGLRSFAVPVRFAVHLHKPLGLRSQVEGTAYFKAPAQSALALTKASGIAGAFFKGTYKLDMVPAAWPFAYHVVGVAPGVVDGVDVLVLRAKPRGSAGGVAQVFFTLTTPALEPVAAQWQYQNASTIQLSLVNGRVGAYTLPLRATITVDMAHVRLDADATYGTYVLNGRVSESVFSAAK